uniref:Phosphoribosylformylglycinamidine synthase subunit PurQ n=1 Tax=uncultured archaeon W5-61a TaxID=1131008 RepID=H9BX94_9ARCH|nr:phosphoribosylformylglycinamidine synthase glutamine amidotransferase subunit [uncultured archaeon W5-61a]
MDKLKVAIVQFPGTNCDRDTYHILNDVLKADVQVIWHEDLRMDAFDSAVIPGGFSYGDNLRAGVIAAYSPALGQLRKAGEDGKPILGICNGFQILVESGLLPGALLRNSGLRFVCRWVNVRVEAGNSLFTKFSENGTILKMPIAHNEGRYYAEDDLLASLERNGQIIFKYVDEGGQPSEPSNPNGSVSNIAGVSNHGGNIVGLMPHPERASESLLSPFRTTHGLQIFTSMLRSVEVLLKR